MKYIAALLSLSVLVGCAEAEPFKFDPHIVDVPITMTFTNSSAPGSGGSDVNYFTYPYSLKLELVSVTTSYGSPTTDLLLITTKYGYFVMNRFTWDSGNSEYVGVYPYAHYVKNDQSVTMTGIPEGETVTLEFMARE